MALDSPLRWMSLGETLAYLAGIVDGDGYFKVSRAYRWSRTVHPYYATTVGVSQLWPGEGVKIFATALAALSWTRERSPSGDGWQGAKSMVPRRNRRRGVSSPSFS